MKSKRYKFAVVSDTQIGSKQTRMDLLHDFYDKVRKDGAEVVLHAGDLCQGRGIYRTEEVDLLDFTLQDQARRVVEQYPVNGLQTLFIRGNHDMKGEGRIANVGSMVTNGFDYVDTSSGVPTIIPIKGRADMTYLGDSFARIKLPDGKTVDIIHPDGYFYSLSYGIQKFYRDQEPKYLPTMAFFGHRHRKLYMSQNGVEAFEAGTFQEQNDFILRKGITPQLGGWMIELVDYGDGSHIVKPRWVGYESNCLKNVYEL